jgi:hypothetical protein
LKNDQLGLLGAGLFEDLMDDAGATFIDRVEASYVASDCMRKVLNAIWTLSMAKDVAERIERLIAQSA